VIGCKGKSFPGVAEPSAEWTDSQHIRIAIAVLGSIVEKHETVKEMSISYELGPVLAEACDWSKSMKGSNVPMNPKADISKSQHWSQKFRRHLEQRQSEHFPHKSAFRDRRVLDIRSSDEPCSNLTSMVFAQTRPQQEDA
jgi:hypothetical protein